MLRSAPKTDGWLDLGCGTGGLLLEGRERGRLGTGADVSRSALGRARAAGAPGVVQASGYALPFPDGSFGLVTAIEYFEHLEHDLTGFDEAFRVLRPGGLMVLTVPAHQHLWSLHDEKCHHFRRYARGDLGAKLHGAGFVVERMSYAMSALYPAVVAARRLGLRTSDDPDDTLGSVPPAVNRLLAGVVRLENRWLAGHGLLWGASLMAVARRP